MSKKTMRSMISYLFTFFIAFFLFLIVISTTTRFTIMSPSYFMNKLNVVGYYSNTAKELNQMIKQNAAPSGFPIEMFENYIKEENIRSDMETYVKDVFAGNEREISIAAIKERLREDTDNYIKEKKIQVTPTLKGGINQFIQTVLGKYQYLTQFPYLSVYVQLVNVVRKGYLLMMPVLILLTSILFLLVYKLHVKRRVRKRYYAYGCIGAGLLISVIPFYLYVVRFVDKINLHPKYMYELLVTSVKEYFLMNIIMGVAFILLGCTIAYFRTKKARRSARYVDVKTLHNLEKETSAI